MISLLSGKEELLLLTYDPHWGMESVVDMTSIVTNVVSDIICQIEHTHACNVLSSSMEICISLANEIISEIVELVVVGSGADVSSNDQEVTAFLCEKNAVGPTLTKDTEVKFSQDVPTRNLAMDLDEIPSAVTAVDSQDSIQLGAYACSQEGHPPCSDAQPEEKTSAEFEELWTKRKLDVEKSAESKARVVFRQWQRDRVTLTQAIDESLKEYADMYEKAHALRLMFEEEKSQWSRQAMLVHAEDTPYGYGDPKRRRCDNDWAPPQPAWPYPQRQSLDSEFQYTVDESQEMEYPSATSAHAVGSCVNRGIDTNNVISPQKKMYKKFTVPVKHIQ